MSQAIPIEIRGVKYKSIAAAARAIGVTPGTIHEARAAGRLERVGLGRLPSAKKAIAEINRIHTEEFRAAVAFEGPDLVWPDDYVKTKTGPVADDVSGPVEKTV